MKFHHKQKVKIINGYYNTYKGFITETRTSLVKDSEGNTKKVIEYKVNITIKDEDKPVNEWIQEKDLKISLF